MRRRSWPTSLASTTPSQALRRYPGSSVTVSLTPLLYPLLSCFCLRVFSPNGALLLLQCTTPPCKGHSPSLSALVHATKCMMGWQTLCSYGDNERRCISSLPCYRGTSGCCIHPWFGFCSAEQKLSRVGGASKFVQKLMKTAFNKVVTADGEKQVNLKWPQSHSHLSLGLDCGITRWVSERMI